MLKPLKPERLYTACEIEQFSFDTTDQLPDLKQIIGQDRALQALHFGVEIQQEGYNLYVLGPTGLGKHTVVNEYLKEQAVHKPPAFDWVYVNNFEKPAQPLAISFSAGQANQFRLDMLQLIEDLRSAIPSAFEAEEYHARIQDIEEELKNGLESAFNTLAEEAESHNIRLLRTPHGFAFAPIKDNEVLIVEKEVDVSSGEIIEKNASLILHKPEEEEL